MRPRAKVSRTVPVAPWSRWMAQRPPPPSRWWYPPGSTIEVSSTSTFPPLTAMPMPRSSPSTDRCRMVASASRTTMALGRFAPYHEVVVGLSSRHSITMDQSRAAGSPSRVMSLSMATYSA